MLDILFLFILATLARYVSESSLKWLAVGFFMVEVIMAFVWGKQLGVEAVLGLALLSAFVYAWVKLLHRAQNNIFTYFVLLLGGTAGLYLLAIKFGN